MMKTTSVISSLIAILATSSAVQASDVALQLKIQPTPKIIGGENTPNGERPWMTSLQSNGSHFCGASLIASEWVLTAAHCVEDVSSSNITQLTIRNNFTDLTSSDGNSSKISAVYVHQDYNQSGKSASDVALLKLTTPITNIQPVALADTSFMQSSGGAGVVATVSGWGVTQMDGNIPNILQKVNVPLITNAVCNSKEAYNGQISDTELCAGYAQGGKDSCQGDSGGPLVIPFNGGFVQAGVVSWGDGCALPNKYGVYARVASFRSWIKDVMDGKVEPGNGGGGNDGTSPPADGQLINGQLIKPLAGEQGSETVFRFDVAEKAKILWVDIRGGEGDADLLMSFEQEPTWDDVDYAPYQFGNDEHIMVKRPKAGTWYIKVSGYSEYSDLELMVFSR